MYDTGLSGNIAAPSRTDLIRQFYLAQRTPITTTTPAPAPAPTPSYTDMVRRIITVTRTAAPTTTAPHLPTTTTPVLVKPVAPTTPVLIAGSGTPSGGSTVTGGTALTPEVMTMSAGGSAFTDTLKAFTQSPLPLILFGLIALAFSDKKGRR